MELNKQYCSAANFLFSDVCRTCRRVEENIQFSLEEENCGKLPFLDTLIIRNDSGAKFRVFRKTTNKEDYVHYLSAHSEKVKSGIIIGFFLRAFRICSAEFVDEEVNHIFEIFIELGYPEAMLVSCKNKAKQIRKNKASKKKERKRVITVPKSSKTEILNKKLKKAGMLLIEKSGGKIGDMFRKHPKTENSQPNSIVYSVPCKGCQKSYYGEPHRGLKTRLAEHKRDFRYHRECNALVTHSMECNHLPNWGGAKIISRCSNKRARKTVEAAFILTSNIIKQRAGFINISTPVATLIKLDSIQHSNN